MLAADNAAVDGNNSQELKGQLKDKRDDGSTLGPTDNRGCTDILWLLIYGLHWIVFVTVVMAGLSDGNPTKLYKPRDYRGDFCGIAKSWNSDMDMLEYKYMIFTMNVSGTVEGLAKDFICSRKVEAWLRTTLTAAELTDYECGCCKTPCPECLGAGDEGFPASEVTDGSLASTLSAQMADLTTLSAGASLFSTGGANSGEFNHIFSNLGKYFNQACVKSCASADIVTNLRSYTYSPPTGMKWGAAWEKVKADGVDAHKSALTDSFTFSSLPLTECPYANPLYCIPFPGIKFSEAAAGYCQFEFDSSISNNIGGGIQALSSSDYMHQASDSIGGAMGDVIDNMDALFITSIFAFICSLVFLTLLRFFIGVVVWSSLLFTWCCLILAGSVAIAKTTQCNGMTLKESGQQMQAGTQSYATGLASGGATNETLTGNGMDYRGFQHKTRTGRTCQAWSSQTPHSQEIITTYPNHGLTSNYCRNPNDAVYIWCFTMDDMERWELCNTLDTLPWGAECPTGYKVADETQRKALTIISAFFFISALIFAVLVMCCFSRIRLAIAVNKVAAQFIAANPRVLFVPIVQCIIGVGWVFLWFFLASFLLSQVPEGYTSTEAYATYAEAYGTTDTPGACTNKAPVGYVWRDDPGPGYNTDHPCSGLTPKCFKCGPPRYIFDIRFFIIFFTFLWNNALLIATGECIIAGAVAVWFFTPNEEKGTRPCIARATKNALFYHLGSLAFGSFIIACVQMIRYILAYFEKQAEAQKNRVMQMILKVLQCVMQCFERCLKFLCRNAYIQVAIRGTNFCTSAYNAFMIIWRNMARFGIIATLGSVVKFCGLGFIICFTTIFGYLMVFALHPETTPIMPTTACFAIAYVVANLFMSVFGLAVDTTLQCVIVAEEEGVTSDFVPGPLKDILPDKNPVVPNKNMDQE